MSKTNLPFEVIRPNQKNPTKLRILTRDEEKILKSYQLVSAKSFRMFYRGLTIASAVPRVFSNISAKFQRDTFEDLADSLQALRDGKMPPKRRFWIERTKKASKDADLAVVVIWLVAFANRPFYGQVAAADASQASIVKDRVSDLLEHNKWLNDHVELVFGVIRSKRRKANGKDPLARVEIIATDEGGGAHGATPDIMIINELSHISKWKFVTTLMNNALGVPQGMIIIATNAGVRGSKAEVWRDTAMKSEDWCVHILARPAPWHTKKDIDQAREINLPSEQLRLWEGVWISGVGDAVDEVKLNRAFCLPGPTLSPEDGWDYVMGLDLGVTHDHSGLAVVGFNYHRQIIKLVLWRRWAPSKKTGEVDLVSVEDACMSAHQIYRPQFLFYDPHQAKFMMQRLKKRGVECREMSFSTPNNLVKMATAYVQVMDAEKFQCYDDEEGSLRRDFAKFNIVKKSYGYRLEAVSDEYGHADVGTAVVIALPYAVESLGGTLTLQPDEALFYEDDEMTKEEVEEMPDDLREIYEMEGSAVDDDDPDGFSGLEDLE